MEYSWVNKYAGKDLKNRLLPFIGSGLTTRAVADTLDCSTVAVWRALKRMGKTL